MKHLDKILIIAIAIFIAIGISSNLYEQYSIDKTKLPLKLETHSRFQRWLSNLKDKGVDLEADRFTFLKDSNIYNTIWTSTISIDDEVSRKMFEDNMKVLAEYKESIKSPNEREIVNFTMEDRFGYAAKTVFFYGLREDRILSTKIADCYQHFTCNFHRGAFMDNHVFFIMELSQKAVPDAEFKGCELDEVCDYTFKVHLVDLNNNSRNIYESEVVRDTYNNLFKKL
jgi:hypothetical protein